MTPDDVLGVLSLIVWSLVLVVSVKYIVFVLRADNRGEGGILALLALLPRARAAAPRVVTLGLFGAALLYGDGVITPAISVLAPSRGSRSPRPRWRRRRADHRRLLLLLFALQKRGTAGVGTLFGPVMLVWFVTIALLGAVEIWRSPGHPPRR